jgi:hypothetical protein
MHGIIESAWHRVWGIPFYQQRLTRGGAPTQLRAVFGSTNQHLIETGVSVPWIWTAERCRQYWASQSEGSSNSPEHYATKDCRIGNFLRSLIPPEVLPQAAILELGSNCGVNLNCLQEAGFENLHGVEICRSAIQFMSQAFPHLVATVHEGSLETMLKRLPSRSYDFIFSVATLMAVHPSSSAVFTEIVRICRGYICTIETEVANCGYIFARNYRRIFERHGCKQISETQLNARTCVGEDYFGCQARLFQVPGLPPAMSSGQ